jgi:hypothetical protein
MRKVMNQRGVALITVFVIGIVSAILLAGMYYMLTRSIQVSGTMPVYFTLRDAAASGVHYAASLIQSGKISIENIYQCIPDPITLKFRLKDGGEIYANTVNICLIGFAQPPGYKEQGVAYSKFIPGQRGYIFLIESTAEGPNNSYSKIEAVYTP